jgi:hypothetical protein
MQKRPALAKRLMNVTRTDDRARPSRFAKAIEVGAEPVSSMIAAKAVNHTFDPE